MMKYSAAAITLYDVKITLCEVWDNRQLDAYKRFFNQFEQVMDKELSLDSERSERARTLGRSRKIVVRYGVSSE